MATLGPQDFNKPCLMTYGEIAERMQHWHFLTATKSPRAADDGDLGPIQQNLKDDEWAHGYALRLAGGLLKLSTEDVR